LEHIAIEMNGALAKSFEIEDAAQGSTNQPLNLLSTSALLASGSFTIRASVGGAGQHTVFGSYPTLTRAFLMGGYLLENACGAKNLGVPKFD
jgi:hypothetical protein